MTRRILFKAAAGAAAAPLLTAGEKIRLGMDAYSIRALEWKAMQLIDYAAKLKLDTIQISSLGDYESLEPEHLKKVRDFAAAREITIDAGIGCVCSTAKSWNAKEGTPEQYLRKGLRVAKAVGAQSMRCFLGSAPERRGPLPIEAHIEKTVAAFRAVRQEAVDAGVKIAIENHNGDLTAREARDLIEAAGKDYVGSCLDSGNPMWLLEDPQMTLEILGPYAVTTHIRDSVVWEHPRGAAFMWVPLGEGVIDFARFVETFRKLCPQSAMQLEIITGRPPQMLPYLEADFWKAFPKLPASDFARFLALVKKGRAYEKPMMTANTEKQPAAYEAALREQQRIDLERSVAYAKNTLGVGLKR